MTRTEIELTGIHLDNVPIHFEEGGIPDFLEWKKWLNQRRRPRQLRLLVDVARPEPIKSIKVLITCKRGKAPESRELSNG